MVLCSICWSRHTAILTDEEENLLCRIFIEHVGIQLPDGAGACYICRHRLLRLHQFKRLCVETQSDMSIGERRPLHFQNFAKTHTLQIFIDPPLEYVGCQNLKNETLTLESDKDDGCIISIVTHGIDINDAVDAIDDNVKNNATDDVETNIDTHNSINTDTSYHYVKTESADIEESLQTDEPGTSSIDNREDEEPENIGFEKIVLSFEEQKAELEALRRAKKYLEAKFKCYNCALVFVLKDSYQSHMVRHEETPTKTKNAPKNKRSWNRKNCCCFCNKLVTNFTRHIKRHHRTETEVVEYLAINDADLKEKKRRRQAFTDVLRNRGNCTYNMRLATEPANTAAILPKRRAQTKKENNQTTTNSPSSFVVCKTCLGTFKRATFYKHSRQCEKKLSPEEIRESGPKNRVKHKAFPLLPALNGASDGFRKKRQKMKSHCTDLDHNKKSKAESSGEGPKTHKRNKISNSEKYTGNSENEHNEEKRKKVRVRWTEEELEVVKRRFCTELSMKINPGKAKCLTVLKEEPLLYRRTWMQLNTCINNIYVKDRTNKGLRTKGKK